MTGRINSWGNPVPSVQTDSDKRTAEAKRLADRVRAGGPRKTAQPKAQVQPTSLTLTGDDLVVLADLLDTHPGLRRDQGDHR